MPDGLTELKRHVLEKELVWKKTRPNFLVPPISSTIWGAIAFFGHGVNVWFVVLLAAFAIAYWISKRAIQWNYMTPEECPDSESAVNMLLFFAGWGTLAIAAFAIFRR